MKNTTPLKADKKVAQVAASQAPAQTTPNATGSRPSTSNVGASAADPSASVSTSSPSDEAIRGRAYEKWQAAGCPEGDGVEFWLDAEKELLASQQS